VGRGDQLSRFIAVAGIATVIASGGVHGEEPVALPAIDVVDTAPLPGLGTPLGQVPSNVQSFSARILGRQRTAGVAEFLEFNANSVVVSSPSGNDFQPDLSFRGFTASPLLGTPQGLSVFQDGVRINEAFADVVHWDLLPQNAIASMQLLPGSNPVFGFNTLGGALAINMKDGYRYGGAGIEAYAGSFGRTFLAADAGGAEGPFGYFVAGEALDERGWREHSKTQIGRLYARGDWRSGADSVGAAFTFADNKLNGTQALPLSMLSDPKQPYTWPDTTNNRLGFGNLNWTHAFTQDTILAANAYYRQLRTSGINSNVNGEYDPATSPSEAFNVQSEANTSAWGASMQLTARRTRGASVHQLVVGAAVDGGATTFSQAEQTAAFVADREAVGTGPFALQTDVDTRVRYAGVYVADSVSLTPQWTVAMSGRYNTARVTTADLTGKAPAIDGTSTYYRLNPAIGATWQPNAAINLFGNVSQGMRIPTPVELTCADPNAPCTLPNIFVADPPLQPVIATTYEAGVRGRIGETAYYSAAVYRTELRNDIQFIGAGSGAVNSGYFQNVGDTRRQGIELTVGAALGEFSLVARYTFLDATFETAFAESSPNNSTADAQGLIAVQPGNRLPGVPRNTLRMRGEWMHGPFALGVTVLAVGSQYARGDENNRDANGPVPGYAVVALDGAWQIDRDWQLFGRIDNLFGTTYQSFGILGANYFRGPGNTFDAALAGPEQFRSPGAPFGAWIGMRYRLDRGSGNR
jgi:outer membrane receptor protein involved in Fe transport